MKLNVGLYPELKPSSKLRHGTELVVPADEASGPSALQHKLLRGVKRKAQDEGQAAGTSAGEDREIGGRGRRRAAGASKERQIAEGSTVHAIIFGEEYASTYFPCRVLKYERSAPKEARVKRTASGCPPVKPS